MKKTIAYKKHSAGIVYIILAIIGIACTLYGIMGADSPFVIVGIITAACGIILSLQYLSTPSQIIILGENDTLILPDGVTLPLSEVTDVSYRRASARGIQYRWGSVKLSTHSNTYKFGFVAECEDVAKELTHLMYNAKYNA